MTAGKYDFEQVQGPGFRICGFADSKFRDNRDWNHSYFEEADMNS